MTERAESFESGGGNCSKAIVSPTALKTSVVFYQLGRRESSALDLERQFQPIDADLPISWLFQEQSHSLYFPCC
jgi:hypothetical protein